MSREYIRVTHYEADRRHGENCSTVTVWSPGRDEVHRPVMMWLHGDAWTMRSGSTARGERSALARRSDVW